MEMKIYRCPSCGYSLKFNAGEEWITCPCCESPIHIEYDRNEKMERAEEFIDPGSGMQVATARIPAGWKSAGQIENIRQSLARPVRVTANAYAPDGSCMFFANNGESFHQIKHSFNQRHQEGGVEYYTRTPLRKFVPPEVYLDQMAMKMAVNGQAAFVRETHLPISDVKNIEAVRRSYYEEIMSGAATLAGSGMSMEVQNIFVGDALREYRVMSPRGPQTLMLGTFLKGAETALKASMMGFGGMMPGFGMGGGAFGMLANAFQKDPQDTEIHSGFMGLMKDGGLVGRMKKKKLREQQEQAAFANRGQNPSTDAAGTLGNAPSFGAVTAGVDWESTIIFGMIAGEDVSEQIMKDFFRFMQTFSFDPQLLRRIDQMVAQEDARLKQANNQQIFAAQQLSQQITRNNRQMSEMQMDSWNKKMAAQDRMREKRWEATMGENIYIRPDGSETSFSNSADRVFMNDKDNSKMFGTNDYSDDAPWGWTELKKKY